MVRVLFPFWALVCFLAFAAAELGRVAVVAPALQLEPFEDDDCLEAPGAEALLKLMHEMCDLLERVLWSTPKPSIPSNERGEFEDASVSDATPVELSAEDLERRDSAWGAFNAWASSNSGTMIELASPVLGRPYCEPGKVSWMAVECLLLLRSGVDGEAEALQCATALDEDLIAQMTPRTEKFNTRLHLVLRSPWPALRLLDLLVRLHPENGCTRMGACKRFRKWNNDPDVFDWPWFKPILTVAADVIASDTEILQLRPEDGPLSRQYRARWLRVQSTPELREAMFFADDVFDAYREHHYRAGCHLGVISAYVLQVLLVHLRDVEGRLQRTSASVAQLINLHAPFSYIVRSDWPLFRLLHLLSMLQRTPPQTVWIGGDEEPSASKDAARTLCSRIQLASEDALGPIYLSAAWGFMAPFAEAVLLHWSQVLAARDGSPGNLEPRARLLFLGLDALALRHCQAARLRSSHASSGNADLHCIDAPQRLGVPYEIAKYLSLAAITQQKLTAIWLDLDIAMVSDPTSRILKALETAAEEDSTQQEARDVIFAKHLLSDSVSPAVVIARGTPGSTDLLTRYAHWLRENPFLLDHQGWDQFLDNRFGDHSAGFDYQGRNVTVKDDDGPKLTFLPKDGAAPLGTRCGLLGHADGFASGDGWLGAPDASGLVLFHFWGAEEAQADLFRTFYPADMKHSRLPSEAFEIILRYRRQITSPPRLAALVKGQPGLQVGLGKPFYVVTVSYADGCCQKSLAKNRRQALMNGVDEARAYGRQHLSPRWAATHQEILSQRKGAGWWLWKPHLILKTLQDPAVPWARGVVIWVDAGNYLQADPRPLVESALKGSDVGALRLKWCLESDWTSKEALQRLGVSERYAITERPQMGAYLLMFRKTELAISFVEEWLEKSQDAATITGGVDAVESGGHSFTSLETGRRLFTEVPGYQKHQADQSIFSILFKDYGFQAVSLEEGHQYVKLDRWRE